MADTQQATCEVDDTVKETFRKFRLKNDAHMAAMILKINKGM